MKKIHVTQVLLCVAIFSFGQNPAIQVEKRGSGKPILYLPGFITPGSVWDETVKNVSGHYEHHLVSYAGFNGIAPIKMPWYETIKKELIDYIKSKKLKSVCIVGHSMGGNLAVDLAAELPDVVSNLVLVDAIPCMRELFMPGVPASQFQYDSPYNKQLLAMTSDKFLENAKMMGQSMTAKADKAETIIKWILDADRETYVYGYTDLLKLDLRDALKNVKATTLILGAPFPDKAIVTTNFEKQYANLTNKTIDIAENSRHFIMFDQPEWLYSKVNAFLNK
jgi:pimeloyl-ACP methyl ester carboxylesterase